MNYNETIFKHEQDYQERIMYFTEHKEFRTGILYILYTDRTV